jgi:hypothetical protein
MRRGRKLVAEPTSGASPSFLKNVEDLSKTLRHLLELLHLVNLGENGWPEGKPNECRSPKGLG